MRKQLAVCISMLIASWQSTNDSRYALLIGIGTYPATAGVEALNAHNDLRLMRQLLQQRGFSDKHILTLADRQATRKGIEHRLDSLTRILPLGSKLVVLFSGHCLQIEDLDHDEADGLDEALLPYDGKPSQPGTLITDDRLHLYLTRLRQRVGPTGHLLFLFDSCHSGSLLRQDTGSRQVSRGLPSVPSAPPPALGASGWYEKPIDQPNRIGRYALMAATTDGQPSYECTDTNGQNYGPLTLAVYRTWKPQAHLTYAAFFEQVRGQMAQLAPYQVPTLEGDRQAPFLGR